MPLDTQSIVQIIVLLLLVLLSAFFSSAETALTTVNKVRLRSLDELGNKRAKRVLLILDKYSKMLSTILIGNNIVNIAASALATTFAMQQWGNYAVSLATGVLTLIILLFGEIVPKTWAMLNAEKIALTYSSVIQLLMILLTPIIFLIDHISHGIMLLLRIDPDKKAAHITEHELKTYVDVSHEEGVIESEEREMIYNVFDFSDAVAKDIMIPRIDMVTVDIDTSYKELITVFKDSMYTRIPVYENDNDNIIGILNIKDLIGLSNIRSFSIRNVLRDAYYTYEYKKTADLLIEMREKAMNVAFVLNEYGATVGMITLEDLLEEIVGEIRDEYDADEDDFIQQLDDNAYLIEGSMKLDDINDALNTDFDSEDYDSIGGLIIESLDRLPDDKEEVTLPNGIRLQVEGVAQNRISKVILTLPDEPETPENDSDADSATAPLKLKKGRPKDISDLAAKEIRCYDFLDNLKMPYEHIHHKALATIADCEEIDQFLGVAICKNLFLCNHSKTEFYLLMLPGDKKFQTKVLSAQLGISHLSFADESYLEEYLDILPGSVSVLGLMNDKNKKVHLLMDSDLLESEYFVCHPCVNTGSIKFSTKDLMKKVIPALEHDVTMVTL